MVEAIVKDKKKVLPCAAYLEGEYGYKGLYVGVPVVIGAGGLEKVIEVKLSPEEKVMSIDEIRHVQTQVHAVSNYNKFFNGMHQFRHQHDRVWYLSVPKSFFDDAFTSGPFEYMIAIGFAFEYVLTNLLFVPFMSGAAYNGDMATVTFGFSAQSDESRHMTLGLEVVKIMLERYPGNVPIIQKWIDKWFWRGHRLLTLVAMMMDYMLPKRVMSWAEAWDIYFEQNGGALFQDLARYGIRMPKHHEIATAEKQHLSHIAWSAFAYPSNDIPRMMTRLESVADSAGELPCPLVVMDTAPAAVLGANFDSQVATRRQKIICNVGNFHTLAFRLGEKGIEGVFEHHTGEIDLLKLEGLIRKLADGSLKHQDVFNAMGHVALMYTDDVFEFGKDEFDVVVTGPRRSMFRIVDDRPQTIDHRPPSMVNGHLRPYSATPFGDLMIAGCFGLLAATAEVMPDLAEPIIGSLRGGRRRALKVLVMGIRNSQYSGKFPG